MTAEASGRGPEGAHGSAIVTGAASGLGAATVARLRAAGFRVTGVDRDFEGPGQDDPGLWFEQADVTSDTDAERIVGAHVARWGALRVLVNCAGIAAPGATLRPSGAMPLDEFRRVMEVNVTGTFNYLRLAARAMQDAPADADGERGVIINTSSIAAFDGMVGQAAYAASKGAVASMTLPLARELGKFGIRVMAIAPGVFSTPMVNGMPPKSRDIVTGMRPPHPDRIGHPQEFAELVMSIIAQHYLNGHVIRLDGGLRMPPR